MNRRTETIQNQADESVHALQLQVKSLEESVVSLQKENEEQIKEYIRQVEEKDIMIEELKLKMGHLSSEFESMLNETMKKMILKLQTVSSRWKELDTFQLSELSERRLADFNLKKLALHVDE